MPVSLESIVPREGFLEVIFSGAYDGPPYRYPEYFKRIFEACEHHRCQRVLLDSTLVDYHTDILTEHNVAEALSRVVPPGVRLAFIGPRTVAPHTSHFETVAVNRGVRARVFWDRQEALDWLLEKPAAAE